jgi:predicted acetyltransferase
VKNCAFWNYFQDYLAEHSVFIGKMPINGVFEYPWFDFYWTEPGQRWPFWATLGEQIAGLALVRFDEAGWREISRFYVLPSFRRRGVGLHFAHRLLSRFPGQWRLNQACRNATAVAFWYRVLDGFVPYQETSLFRQVERVEQPFIIE